MLIYGKPVVMVTAGCVKKTNDICNCLDEKLQIIDSYGENYTLRNVCNYCYNIIYNSKAINIIEDIFDEHICENYRIDFTDEGKNEIRNIMNLYVKGINSFSIRDKFKGHYFRKIL